LDADWLQEQFLDGQAMQVDAVRFLAAPDRGGDAMGS
jgi:hypothetical protein